MSCRGNVSMPHVCLNCGRSADCGMRAESRSSEVRVSVLLWKSHKFGVSKHFWDVGGGIAIVINILCIAATADISLKKFLHVFGLCAVLSPHCVTPTTIAGSLPKTLSTQKLGENNICIWTLHVCPEQRSLLPHHYWSGFEWYGKIFTPSRLSAALKAGAEEASFFSARTTEIRGF